MQQPMVPADDGIRLSATAADAMPDVESLHYGFGLFQVDDVRFGRIVGHAGGYPGFGSHMRWHPASGLGVIAFANGRYAPASLLAKELLGVLLQADVAPPRRIRASGATRAAVAAVEALIADWDDDRAANLFAMNVELDEPIASRKEVIARIRERHGRLTPNRPARPVVDAFHHVWWLSGERGGRVRVEILLTPEATPKVQSLAITSIPVPPAELRRAAEALVAAINTRRPGGPDWPADIAIGPDVDLEAARRQLRAAEARFGRSSSGRPSTATASARRRTGSTARAATSSSPDPRPRSQLCGLGRDRARQAGPARPRLAARRPTGIRVALAGVRPGTGDVPTMPGGGGGGREEPVRAPGWCVCDRCGR
jgi:hypothetical protein